MRFITSLLACAFSVIFSSGSLYASVAGTGDELLRPRTGASRAPACDADEGECPAAVEMSVLRAASPYDDEENRDRQRMFGDELSEDEGEGSKHTGD